MISLKHFLLKNWWFIFLVLTAGFILANNMLKNSRLEREIGFSIPNTNQITRVIIKDILGTINIELKDDNWFLNNEFRASDDAVQALFRVLSRLHAASPVPLSVNDSLVKLIKDNGLQVDIYISKKRARRYNLLSTQTLNLGAIGLLRRSQNAYKLELPSFDGDIVELFKTNPNYWKSNQLSIPGLSSINAVEVEIPQDIENSFRIDFLNDGEYRLFSLFNGTSATEFDVSRVEVFLNHLTSISYSEVETGLSLDDKTYLLSSEPDFIYTIYLKNGTKHQVKVFPIPVDEYFDEFGRAINFDLNRIYISQSADNSLYIVNFLDFHNLMRNISYFNPKFGS